MPKISCIIQARMGSTRFPGKNLAPILNADKPNPVCALEMIGAACAKVQEIDQVVIACPTGDEETFRDWAVLQEEYTGKQFFIFGGHPENVYWRVLQAAKFTKTDYIVDITGDCPLIPAWELRRMVRKFLFSQTGEYLSNVFPYRMVPDGWDIQIYTTAAMERHLPAIKWECHTGANLAALSEWQIRYEPVVAFAKAGNLRITLDTREDLEVIRKVARLYMDEGCLGSSVKCRRFLKHLQAQPPEWWTNAAVVAKEVGQG